MPHGCMRQHRKQQAMLSRLHKELVEKQSMTMDKYRIQQASGTGLSAVAETGSDSFYQI